VNTGNRGADCRSVFLQKPGCRRYRCRLPGGYPVWIEAVQVRNGYTIVNLMRQIAERIPIKFLLFVWYTLRPANSDPRNQIGSAMVCASKAAANDQIYSFPTDMFGWDTPEMRWILGAALRRRAGTAGSSPARIQPRPSARRSAPSPVQALRPPRPGGQVHRAPRHARLHDRRDQQVRAKHVLVAHLPAGGVGGNS